MPILAFHKTAQKLLSGMNNYAPNRFLRLVQFIQSAGFEIVPLKEYAESIEKAKQVVLTFDDGYELFYKGIYPILSELSLPATVFIPVDYIGKTDSWDYTGFFAPHKHLTKSQIVELSQNGIEFGSHGLTHENLTGMAARRLKLQLERSKLELEKITGRKTTFLSYPFGRFNKEVEVSAMAAGYIKGFSLSYMMKSSAGFTLPRYAIYTIDTPYSVMKKLRRGPLNLIEIMKGAIINGYAAGTIILNRLRK